MKSITEIFPNASASTVAANPHLCDSATVSPKPKENDSRPIVAARRGIMNKTEQEFAMILEARKRRGEIRHYEFEGITLRWNGISYTPDFIIFYPGALRSGEYEHVRLIEVKGAFTKGKFERAVERFRHARTYWTGFEFQLWQKTKDGWGTPKI